MNIECFSWNLGTQTPYKPVSFTFSKADIIAIGFQELSSQTTLQSYASQIATGPLTMWLNFLKLSVGLDYKLVAVQRIQIIGRNVPTKNSINI
jgi:hypothetical protein